MTVSSVFVLITAKQGVWLGEVTSSLRKVKTGSVRTVKQEKADGEREIISEPRGSPVQSTPLLVNRNVVSSCEG